MEEGKGGRSGEEGGRGRGKEGLGSISALKLSLRTTQDLPSGPVVESLQPQAVSGSIPG